MAQSSLHTKHRPNHFKEVIGHEEILSSLKKVVKDKRAKSFIFTGPSGVGKTTLARILANEFADRKATVANILEIDAATNTGVDAARSLASKTLYKAIGSSPVKAIIMDEAHRLSSQAWSSLLKPIEEPPAHVYWMFCTTEHGKIPKTIQTRCLSYDLKPLSEEDIYNIVVDVINKEDIDISEDIIEAISENSGGSPRQALIFLEECMYCESVKEALSHMKSAGESKEIIDLCKFLLKYRGRSWNDAVKLLNNLEGIEAESIRIVVLNYMSKVLLNKTDKKKTLMVLHIIECFSTPYNQTDKFAPLLISIAEALELGD